MAKKRKKTALQKNRDRINRQIREAERRGYRFEAAFKERIKTASVQQLSHWKGDYIYRYAERDFIDAKTGRVETVRGLEARKRERAEVSRRAAEERWKKQSPTQQEPGVEPEEQAAETDEERRAREEAEEEERRREEEERRKQEADANVDIQNIIDLLSAPNNSRRAKAVSEAADLYCEQLLKVIDAQQATFDGKIALSKRIKRNTDRIEENIDRIKYDSDQYVITNAYNLVLEAIADTVGFDINDDFFQELEDSWY